MPRLRRTATAAAVAAPLWQTGGWAGKLAALLFLFSPDVAGVLIRKGERDLAVDLLHVFGLFLPVAAVTNGRVTSIDPRQGV